MPDFKKISRFKRKDHFWRWMGKEKWPCVICGVEDKGERMIVVDDTYSHYEYPRMACVNHANNVITNQREVI